MSRDIPDEAVEAAAEYLPHSLDCQWQPDSECPCWRPRVTTMRAALEAAAPYMHPDPAKCAILPQCLTRSNND